MSSQAANESPTAPVEAEASSPVDGSLLEMAGVPTAVDEHLTRFQTSRMARYDRVNRELWEEALAVNDNLPEGERHPNEVLFQVYLILLCERGIYNGKKDKENSSIKLFRFEKQKRAQKVEKADDDEKPVWENSHHYR